MKLYKINQYEVYRMDEQGVYFDINEPCSDTCYYKSEVECIEVELPEGFSVVKDWTGLRSELVYGEDSVLIGEDEKGIYFEICDYNPRKVYVNIIG